MIKKILITDNILEVSRKIGLRLRERRFERNETQDTFAFRLGISRSTYAKMESGSLSVSLGEWLQAAEFLGSLDEWTLLFKKEMDPFEEYDKRESHKKKIEKSRVRPGKRG